MKRFVLVLMSFGGCIATAHADLHLVNVGGSAGQVFAPQELTINAHDTVVFVNKGGGHNVAANDHSFRCAQGCDGDGKGGSGNVSAANWEFSLVFDTPGDVGYFCEAHGSPFNGMYGVIHVMATTPVRLISFGVD